MKSFIIIFLVSSGCLVTECANILAVFPTPSISHQVVFRPLIKELVKRGHRVTVITTDPAYPKGQAPTNLTEIDVHDVSYKIWRERFLSKASNDILTQLEMIMTLLTEVFEAQLATPEVQDVIKKKTGNFDLILLEAFLKYTLIFSHIFKAPVIQISSFGGMRYNFETVGAPVHPLLYPPPIHQRLYNLTLWEKVQQLYIDWRSEQIFADCEKNDNTVLQRIFGRDTPSVKELSDNVHMLFVNTHSAWSNNQPVPPSVVHITGINKMEPKALPQNLQSLLDSSKNGVIYFSLGTNVKPSLLPPSKIQMLVKVFSELPYDVIWKWDKDTLPGQTDNINIYKWLPQTDLLRHPKVKLFVTQGGLQSTEEAINAEVPLIGIPMIADQWYNVEKYEYHRIGVKLDISTLNEDQFKDAVQKVISDKSYRANIKRLHAIMEDEPQQPLERAAWWTEYVIRHGGAKHLRAAAANMGWSEYLELELVAVVVFVLLLALVLTYVILKTLIRFVLTNIDARVKIKVS